ncbi:hypothetical protein [Ammoniphilus sp. 3BR4]|uniref:hypothetical protein n=1 Tax=Ammoniphilus sp. 3BR4 TaxID=3158265 RepID=UPI003466D7EB
MIHRDLCDPAYTKNYSSLRMQFHFVLSRFVCVDGLVPLTKEEIAQEMKCDIQSVYKHMRAAEKDGVIRVEGDRIYLLKHVPSKDYKEGYVKHYPFIESDKFKALSVQAQRFILYTLWVGVYNQGRKLEREVSTLYHKPSQHDGVLNIYSKKPALVVLEEAKTFLKFEPAAKGENWFKVTGVLEQFEVQPLKNQGDIKWLDDLLVTSTCDLLSDKTKGDMIAIKKQYFYDLGSIGLELFAHALDKVLLSFKLYQLELKNEVIPYLRGTLLDLKEKILPTIQKNITYTKQALQTSKDLLVNGTRNWVSRFEKQLVQLQSVRDYILTNLKKKEEPKEKRQQQFLEPFPFYNWLEKNDTDIARAQEKPTTNKITNQVNPSQQKEALDLLLQLEEIDQKEYQESLKHNSRA